MTVPFLSRGTCLALAFALVAVAAPAAAAEPSALASALREIASTGRVLVVTAHPDDEHNAVLAALARGRGLRVVLFTLTRGEGGRDATGAPRGAALGLLRTGEALLARRVDGAEQMFGQAFDSGDSFGVEGTLTRWGGPAALGDVVRAVRLVRPDVILTLPSQATDGSQHHQASARLAREAFRAASDPARFPEHLTAGLRAWQATKIYEGGIGGGPFSGPVTVLTSPVDPLARATWQDVGQRARAAHRSQGAPKLQVADPRFTLVDSTLPVAPEADPLDGIDTSLPGLVRTVPGDRGVVALLKPGLQTLAVRVAAAAAAFEPASPWRAVPALRGALEALRHWRERVAALPAGAPCAELLERLDEREPRFEHALALAHGLELRADADDVTVTAGQTIGVLVTVRNTGPVPVRIERLELVSGGRWPVQGGLARGLDLLPRASVAARVLVTVPAEAAISQPHWRREAGHDRVGLVQPAFFGRPFPPPELVARLQYGSGGVGARLETTVGKDVAGIRHEVAVMPAVTIDPPPQVVIAAGARKAAPFDLEISAADHTRAGGVARVRVRLPEGWRIEPAEAVVGLAGEGASTRARFRVSPPARVPPGALELPVEVKRGERTFSEAVTVVEIPGSGPRRAYSRAAVPVVASDARTRR